MDKNEWSIAEARLHLSEVVKRSKIGPQVLENRGKPVAAVVDSEMLGRLLGLAPVTKGALLLQSLARVLAQDNEDVGLDLPHKTGPRDPFQSKDEKDND